MTDLHRALQQIRFAREYTLRLIDAVRPDDWFRIPPSGITHVGWQVGHVAFSEYRLTLLRIRGASPGDKELISDEFVQRVRAGSAPEPDPARNPTVDEIRATLERVHARALAEVPAYDPAMLAEPMTISHPFAKTKLESLFWCSAHEFVHAGQIGLLRRQLGAAPLW